MTEPIHIVTRFNGLTRDDHQAAVLAEALGRHGPVQLWTDRPGASGVPARLISPFGGQLPRGGTLIFYGTHFDTSLWLDHVKPRRLIVHCHLAAPAQVFAFLSGLERPSLPKAELVFASALLQRVLGLPGRIATPLVDLERFRPTVRAIDRPDFHVGRRTLDEPWAHHPDDAALYRMLGCAGIKIAIQGAPGLSGQFAGIPNIHFAQAEHIVAEHFLNELDAYFFRSAESWLEASGQEILEALACGLPVVAHRQGAHADWFDDGQYGWLINTQEEAYDRIGQLSLDPALRQALGASARRLAECLAAAEARAAYLGWLRGDAV